MRVDPLNRPRGRWAFSAACLALLLAACPRAHAGAESAGSTAANFIKILPSARAAAMGQAYAGFSDDSGSLAYNPAGLADMLQNDFAATHVEWFQDLKLENFTLRDQLDATSYLGIFMTYFDTGEMIRTLRTGANSSNESLNFIQTGTFNNSDLALGVSLSETFWGRWHLAASLAMLQQAIDDQAAYGFSSDLGLLYTGLAGGLDLGLSLQNLGTQVVFISQGAAPPFDVRAGASLQLGDNFQAGADLVYSFDQAAQFSAGGEYWFWDMLALRAGFVAGAFSQWTLGAGLRVDDMGLDYALVPYADLGWTHRVTATYRFGKPQITLESKPAVIAPRGDDEFKLARLTCPVLPKRSKVRHWIMTLRDSAGQLIRQMSGDGPLPEPLVWDGHDTDGRLVPDGQLWAVVEVRYPAGILARSDQATVTVDDTPPAMNVDLGSEPPQLGAKGLFAKPLSIGLKAEDLHAVGGWRLEVRDAGGNLVKLFGGKGSVPATLAWDGRGDTRTFKVQPGQAYTLTLLAKDTLGNWGRTKPQKLGVARKEIHLRLSSDVLFATGQAELAEGADSAFGEVESLIRSSNKMITGVDIIGHTDNQPIRFAAFASNAELSLARAKAVKDHLVERLGVDPSLFHVEGRGDTQPIADNGTEEGKQKNRRVEFVIHTKEYQ